MYMRPRFSYLVAGFLRSLNFKTMIAITLSTVSALSVLSFVRILYDGMAYLYILQSMFSKCSSDSQLKIKVWCTGGRG